MPRLPRRPAPRLLLLLGALVPLSGCGRHQGEPPTPGNGGATAALRVLVADVRHDDLVAFWKHGLPPATYAAVERDWQRRQQQAATERARAGFRGFTDGFDRPRAAATLAAQWQPTLVRLDRQYSDQLPVLIAIGGGMVRQAANRALALDTAHSRSLEPLLAPWVSWAEQAPWLDLDRSRQAAEVAVETVRSLRLTTFSRVSTLDFTAAMARASRLLAGAKRCLALYGLSLDEVLDSAQVSLASRKGDLAWVRIDYVLQGQPRQAVLRMQRVDGHWYPMALPRLAGTIDPPDWAGWAQFAPDRAGVVARTGDPRAVPVQ
ncbi:hypothetical protein ATSB10_26360 [Dyella thiooxydans]|uniref:Uncharacterized protein n=1 Tax=Dyella thiooxydans TaxID=445710 RepID=A0A160N2P3_9GAMM|nr:hypothetical protein [Dyella thiooxydans]AND70090.1 hypothetical protein ATSB10_26360 [Dyella thiooxydans]